MNKLVYIGFAFKHHRGTQAGYHHIKDYLHYDYIFDTQWEFDLLFQQQTIWYRKIVSFIIRHTLGVGCPVTILRCIMMSLLKKNLVFHFIYAEGNYKWLHHFLGKTNKVVCSFHQPADILEDSYGWRRDLPNIDKVILLSGKDQERFERWTGKKNVKFIPHGINTDFYAPAETVAKERTILMVGNWLRDFNFANQVFTELLLQDETLTIIVVTNENNFSKFALNNRLFLKTKISDEELRDLYRKSTIVFLPLISYTANNAIMEAVATGCQIVIATDRADSSYFKDSMIDILPLQQKQVVDFLLSKMNSNYNYQLTTENRRFIVENYSWKCIAEVTREYLLDDVSSYI